MSEESEDLLAGGEAPAENQETEAAEQDFEQGPPPSEVQMPDWVPAEYQDPGKRDELLDALGVKVGKQMPTERPEFVPEKFWKDGEGLQLETAFKAYSDLENTLNDRGKLPPENYEIEAPEGVKLEEGESFLSDEDVELFKDLGLTNEQAQKVTNYYWENALPALMEERGRAQLNSLAAQWNMKPGENDEMPAEFKQRLGSIKQWAEKNLPEESVKHLRSSASGVQAMWAMMQNKAALPTGDGKGTQGMSDEELRAAINSDEYWSGTNPEFNEKITEEYQRRFG